MQCLICKKELKNTTIKFCKEHYNPKYFLRTSKELKTNYFNGTSPTIFVGEYGYPYVNVGIVTLPEINKNAWIYDTPKFWAENRFHKTHILNLRTSLINTRFNQNIKSKEKLLDLAQELTMSSKPVDIEFNLYKKPKIKTKYDNVLAPMGPSVNLINAQANGNINVNNKIEKVVSDTDLNSTKGVKLLYKKGINDDEIIKLFSIGNLGLKKNRKLVPSKWSITAIHDILGKNISEKIKSFKTKDFKLYFGGYMGNYFFIFTIPNIWSYELFEIFVPKPDQFTTDHEFHNGKKTYSFSCAGGYYASRLSILEKLEKDKEQATVIAIRLITKEYDTPLGVWVMQNASRLALNNPPLKFETKESMINYALKKAKKEFNIDLNEFLKVSKILTNLNCQKRLFEF